MVNISYESFTQRWVVSKFMNWKKLIKSELDEDNYNRWITIQKFDDKKTAETFATTI